MFEIILVGIILTAAGYITCNFPRKRHGRITLGPGEGQIYVKLDFEPNEVEVYFLDECPHHGQGHEEHGQGEGHGHDHHDHSCTCCPPSCASLKDEIHTIRIWPRGFKFMYVIESGIRTIEWKVTR